MIRSLLLLIAVAAATYSCSLDYAESRLATEISEDIPDTVLNGVVHTVVRDNIVRFRITAARVEAFTDLNRQLLFDVGFSEYGSDGDIRTEGTADFAEFHTDTDDAEITGKLRFYSVPDDAWLNADYLYWNSEERQLTSHINELVTLEKGDGTNIEGRGFTAELDQSLLFFSGGVSGAIVDAE